MPHMTLKTMDPDLIRELLSQEVDVLTPAAEADAALYANAACPNCHARGCRKETEAIKTVETEEGVELIFPFGSDSLISLGHSVCVECNTEFDPRTGLIRHAENVMIHDPHSDPHRY
jgi:hypothetical protein